MKTIEWEKRLSVNNVKIDNQHKSLFELTNNLILNSEAEPNSKIVNETLYELLKYTESHFIDEEKLFAIPPIKKVGDKPANSNIQLNIAVVLVLPWVPVTTIV